MGMSRKVQMLKMWREGHRRSPRISALGAWKDQAPRPPVKQKRRCGSRTSASASASPSVSVSVYIDQQKEHHPEGPASRTRAKKKRKLKPLQDVASSTPSSYKDPKSSGLQDGRQQGHGDHPININQSSVQDKDSQKHEDQATHTDQPSSMPFSSWMPEKRILELIIDILQRRDTYEIFAEPVDPSEVEDYYEIIDEPMDFGTMRAKLHEGMYKSLDQFEHDVFLISRNAMHFNSSATIYFRQAHAIDELAKKVFHVIKTDPKNFELEFVTRRRSGRRTQGEARGSTYSSSSKLATNSRCSRTSFNASTKTVPCSTNDSLNLGRAARANHGCSSTSACYDTTDHDVLFGGRDVRRPSSSEVDRRSTYKPWMSILNESSVFSTIYCNSKVLMHVNQQDIGYHKSLMTFVKDLGPTAQMIAKRKLSGWSNDNANFLPSSSNCWPKASDCQNYLASPSAHWPGTTLGTVITDISQNLSSVDGMDICDADRRERNYAGNQMGACDTSLEVAPKRKDKSTFGSIRGEVHSSDRIDFVGVTRNDKIQQNQNSGMPWGSHSSIADARDLKYFIAGVNNTNNKSATLKLEKSKMDNKSVSLDSAFKDCKPNALNCRLSDNHSFLSYSWPLQTTGISSFDMGSMHYLSSQSLRGGDQAIAPQGPMLKLGHSSEMDQTLKSSEPWTPVSPYFFDLPFLKTRLDQINLSGQDRFLQQSSGRQGPFLDRMSEAYNEKHPRSSMDIKHTNLALQL